MSIHRHIILGLFGAAKGCLQFLHAINPKWPFSRVLYEQIVIGKNTQSLVLQEA